ncbi:MAG TPA: NUDIX domain-containing protein [Spongiibacteraceae bacterium]|nr:NUDIX domain-containing protein [Spongiibacteraceae bacterium]
MKPELGRDDVEILARERGYDGFFKLDRLRLRHRKFDGDWSAELPRELIVRRDAVGVLLYDPQLDAIALVEQFRTGIIDRVDSATGVPHSPWILELVAGLIDRDETPAEVAQRETFEEANCKVLALEPIFDFFMSPGGTNEYLYLFCARCDLRDAGGVHGLPEEHEDIRVHVIDYSAAIALLQSGGVKNAITIVALQWLQMQRDALRQRWR